MIFFFFNDTATTEIYTLSLHDALPILVLGWPSAAGRRRRGASGWARLGRRMRQRLGRPLRRFQVPYQLPDLIRSEEHTSELQSQSNLVCRLLLEKKKKERNHTIA